MENNNSVREYYENSFNENEREGRETLEFSRSKSIISRYLSAPNMNIADVGGATGAYSYWLAKMGHHVHLLDLAKNHVEIAMQKGQDTGVTLASYKCADARELPYESESMDMVLLMGALYHFRDKESRLKCLTEASRVLKKRGILITTIMNRYNYLISSLKYKHLIEGMGIEPIEKALTTGIIDNTEYTRLPLSYGYIPGEIVLDMNDVGFTDVNLIAVEGIANALGNNQLPEDKNEAERLLRCIELVESAPELMGVSRNIIAVGRK